MPDAFLAGMSAFQARLAARRLGTLDRKVARRRAVAQRYSSWLAAHGCTPAYEPDSVGHAFLRYPLRVRERDAFVAEAERRGVLLGDWFHSPLYPIAGDLTRWGYRLGEHTVAERVTADIVNLPTDIAPDGAEADAVEGLLEACLGRIA
jgi:perosamine synthetase